MRMLALWLMLAFPLWAQVQLGGNVQISGTTLICGTPSSGTVATPTFSVSSGAVSPGTEVDASDSTNGATIYYTLTTDGTTPPDPTYDSTTYMPTENSTTFIVGTAAANGIFSGETSAERTFVPNFNVYGNLKIKMLAAVPGMTDSAIASASYSLTAATGTVVSSCGSLPSTAGNYYLAADLTCPGTGIQFGGDDQVLNLNGYTLTYGTSNAPVLSGSDLTTTATSTSVSCSSCTFTSGMVGDYMLIDNYNQGGYQNNGTVWYLNPTIATFVDAHDVTLSTAVAFSVTNGEYLVFGAPVYGVLCNKNGSGGANCTGSEVFNGTITQSANAGPYSSAVVFQAAGSDYPMHGGNLVANLTENISGIEAQGVYIRGGNGGDSVLYNLINDSVTSIYYRDGLPYPISFNGVEAGVSSPIDTAHDNKVYGSSQGGIYLYWTGTTMNDYFDSGPTQYANGFGVFLAAANSTTKGDSINGYTQGVEEEASSDTVQHDYIAIEMQDPVHDPNHNVPECELGYGYREKDFHGTGNEPPLLPAGSGAPLVDNVVKGNIFDDISGACGVNDIEFSLVYINDTTSVLNNTLTLNMNASDPTNASEIYGAVSSDLTGVTYSGNTNAITGTYASQGYAAYVNVNGVTNWTLPLPGLPNPAIVWRQYTTGNNVTATFTGTGTATCTMIPYGGSTATWTATFNGVNLPCPQ